VNVLKKVRSKFVCFKCLTHYCDHKGGNKANQLTI